MFRSPNGKKVADAAGYTALYGWAFAGEEKLDEAIALVFAAPASYTGEDVVELSCHGGVFVMRRVLEAVLAAGASPAGPGEFTKRAFLNGKLGLTEAEAVMQVISAQGTQAARAAGPEKKALWKNGLSISGSGSLMRRPIWQLGGLSRRRCAAGGRTVIIIRFADLPGELEKLLKQFDAGRAVREGVDTAIVGRPNVGKSTLMNLLAGCERSIVTQYAGTTRDVVEDTVVLGDVLRRLADTAGIRQTNDPVESIGVDMARSRMQSAQLVLAVFDASEPLIEEDQEAHGEFARRAGSSSGE